MHSKGAVQLGEIVCRLMRHAWRKDAPFPGVSSAELGRALECLVSMGAAPLIWPRVRHVLGSTNTRTVKALQAAYNDTVLDNKHFRPELLADLARLLEQGGIQPLIFKGWSLAKYYHPPAQRPLGDIDLCVPPGRYADAADLIAAHAGRSRSATLQLGEKSTTLPLENARTGRIGLIDLQLDLARFRLEPLSGVFERSRRAEAGGHELRVPCPEDHLRLLCLHFLEHGACRPVWLCDVAGLLETETEDFDWDLCLGDDPVTEHWICIVVVLAQKLLGANLSSVPEKYRETNLPAWLIPAVLSQWGKPYADHAAPKLFAHVLRRTPHRIATALFARWPDPITARFDAGSFYKDSPHWPYQALYFVRRGADFARRIVPRLSRG